MNLVPSVLHYCNANLSSTLWCCAPVKGHFPFIFILLNQVAEYLKNLGTEYRFSCYYEKEAKGCHLLADYMEAIDHDSKTAFQAALTRSHIT